MDRRDPWGREGLERASERLVQVRRGLGQVARGLEAQDDGSGIRGRGAGNGCDRNYQ